MVAKTKGRVAVAMSGGVDSSTAAALLQQEGYEVIGLTMHLWNQAGALQDSPALPAGGASGQCCSPEDIRDARRVADQIGIAHYVINLRRDFEAEVVEDFAREYLRGRTPNPCIRCNERIKFRLLLRKAEALGAVALATGHYARIARDASRGRFLLLRGKDLQKDQSYFLFSLTQEQMAKVLFPLGEKSKGEVRALALKWGLRVARKAESQEVCFIPENDYRRFLESRAGQEISRPGEIVNREGEVLGFHQGVYGYTIGQRRGLGLAAPQPYYVLALDCARNHVVVGPEKELLSTGLVARDVNWVALPGLAGKTKALVRIRHRHPGAPAVLSPLDEGRVRVELEVPQKSVTPGQAAVFYQGEEVLGGGWIEKPL